MGKFYIYNANLESKEHKKATIVFNPDVNFDFDSLKKELADYFKEFYHASALVFIHCSSIDNIDELIDDKIDYLLKSIPKVEENSLRGNVFKIAFNQSAFIPNKDEKFLEDNLPEIINQGLANIFIKHGGLIETSGVSHHYVFPSGKHSAKFLRTANVLVKRSEIDFIGLKVLHLFKGTEFDNIYCDTLSISVIGYSINNYLRRYQNNKEINVESFRSYNGIYSKDYNFYDNPIFLISASTSGGLVNYLQKNHPEIDSKQICTLFYLPIEKHSTVAVERVACNLEKNESLGYGIEIYDTFKPTESCNYCNNGSTPVQILGDSFSLDEPIIKTKNIQSKEYISKSLKDFVELFKYKKGIGTSLKVSFSEYSTDTYRKKYNLYIDYENIIDNIEKEDFAGHKEKIDAYIKQYVPASTKYIIHLNDKGSLKLANYINNNVSQYSKSSIQIINQSELREGCIREDESGAIVIVGSCITNGKNLLYLNRFFRNFAGIRLVYFIGINRVSDQHRYKELKSNIKYGLYGSDNSSFVEIETISCDNSNYQTPWEIELDHLKAIQEKLDAPSQFITDRVKVIDSFSNTQNKGGTNSIFYTSFKNEELAIRKNSAFFHNNDYYDNITQSDVYFTISCVLNNMRNNKVDGLYQTNFVKNLLDPFVFNRFNDGIIQASILRTAKSEELNYSFSFENSSNMLMLIKTFIKYIEEYQGEAIFEFLHAISIGKLRLFKEHYKGVIEELDQLNDKLKDERITIFRNSIRKVYDNCLGYYTQS